MQSVVFRDMGGFPPEKWTAMLPRAGGESTGEISTRVGPALATGRRRTEKNAMHLGFVSAILPDQTLEQVLAFAAAERFACVEVMCWPVGRAERKFAGVTHVDVTRFTRSAADDVLGKAARHGVCPSPPSATIPIRSTPTRRRPGPRWPT